MSADEINQAMAHWQRGQHNAARSKLLEYIEMQPDDFEGWFAYGQVLLRMNDLVAARAAFQEAADLAPANQSIPCAMAKLELIEGRPTEALDRLALVLESRPDYEPAVSLLQSVATALAGQKWASPVPSVLALPFTALAKAFADQNRLDEARAAANLALNAKPRDADLVSDLGCILLLWIGDHAVENRNALDCTHEALHAFLTAIEIDPHHAVAYRNLGGLMRSLGERGIRGAANGAAYCVMREYQSAGDNAPIRPAMADILFSRRRLAEAAAMHCGELTLVEDVVESDALAVFFTDFDDAMAAFHAAEREMQQDRRRDKLVIAGHKLRDLGLKNDAALVFGLITKELPDHPARGDAAEMLSASWLFHQSIALCMNDKDVRRPPVVMPWPRRPINPPELPRPSLSEHRP